MSDAGEQLSFDSLGLSEPVLRALADVGYESPSPIQAASIPHLINGKNLLGMAQTGTGKTAAFALPLLSRLDTSRREPQLLVLAPTRELAIQVAEACQTYAKHLPDFHVLPIYGGQAYDTQLRQLRRGAQVIVGTPGRIMDHLRRGSLKLDNLTSLVLDEADEMLRMGFIDDVEWILEHTPPTRQIALFSATMPAQIKRVAQKYLQDAEEVKIASKTATATTITQKYLRVSGHHKLEALTRILEIESFDALLIFVRTKSSTEELAEKLSARGYAAEALNGDISQQQRERIVERLKSGKIDVLVGTDVVARGLDVERISHVLNYDIPYDTESYVHRIGRTGRAGRKGEAILFVAPRETRMLNAIEKATRQPLQRMELPSVGAINEKRVERFMQRITDTLDSDESLSLYLELLSDYQKEHDTDPMRIAAALAALAQGETPLLLDEREIPAPREIRDDRRDDRRERRGPVNVNPNARPLKDHPEIAMKRYVLMVGRMHGVMPKNIVGAIANEAGIAANLIGQIDLYDDFSTVDLPDGMSKEVMQALKKAFVCGQRLNIHAVGETPEAAPRAGRRPGAFKGKSKGKGTRRPNKPA
ncbi:ATP-dependent RNA helicase DeaD [Marinobacterium nitratireducens]|uniref:ATP-dependent RNA helicase DeaD n=1 Tax=Marinobacterium nitratireducens TaxID=518897 RepID=A0A917ZNB6_9GAMM|nr:DEAD/DEAH box helicase [Marinobacterium nitratireducens]GGO87295.1 ATP-dependent RNA helicase DeaD [Marinobacterium nitratireducens]